MIAPTSVPSPPSGIAAAEGDPDLFADHLADHIRRAPGNIGECDTMTMETVSVMLPSSTSQTAWISSAEERAPGSRWPMERSPRKAARPLVARMGLVARRGRRRRAARRGAAARGQRRLHRDQHVEHGLGPGVGLAARFHRLDAGSEHRAASRRRRRRVGAALPIAISSEP